jgi:hypothetical protein
MKRENRLHLLFNRYKQNLSVVLGLQTGSYGDKNCYRNLTYSV